MKHFLEKITSSEGALDKRNIIFEPIEVDLVPEGSLPKDVIEELDLDTNEKLTIYRNSVGVHGYVSETGAYFNLPALPSLDIMSLQPKEVMVHRMYLLLTIKLLLTGLDEKDADKALEEVVQYDYFNEMEPTEIRTGGYIVKTVPANSFIHMYIYKENK